MNQLISLTADVPTANRFGWLFRSSDWLGITASIGCAIHCAAMPFVIAYLLTLGLSFLADDTFHKWMAAICFAIALAAFLPGWRRHRRLLPMGIGIIGLTLICGAAFGLVGDCCPSCPSCQSFGAASADLAGCNDTCREPYPAEPGPIGNEPSAAVAAASAQTSVPIAGASQAQPLRWSWFVPWLTPLGGLVLVTAHLMNHRLGCSCRFCHSEPGLSFQRES